MGLELLSAIIVAWGAIILTGTVFKQDYYWETERTQHSREWFGEKRAAILHSGIGILMIVIGLWVILS
ncbi:MAG: hypothetical protein GY803_08810 [Chloroflexi bacterium]|nr:hypothetical protein [Chloroflexota bacterium]